MTAAQIIIMLSTALALPILLNTRPATPWHRIGCLVAFAGQPFWLIETMRAGQFGMFCTALWLTGIYAFGLFRPARRSADIEYVDLQRKR